MASVTPTTPAQTTSATRPVNKTTTTLTPTTTPKPTTTGKFNFLGFSRICYYTQ